MRKIRTALTGAWILLVLVSCSQPAWGQVVVNGTVANESKRPLESARVTLEPENRGATLETDSNKNGEFNFNLSSAGQYFFSVSLSGFYRNQ